MRFVLLAATALAAAVPAQLTNVLPTSANGVAGSGANVFPWGTTAVGFPGLRIMCIYDAANFTTAPTPVTAPILITNVKWRANDVTTSWTGGTYAQATLALGTAAVDHLAASTTWASNVGPDYTVVHSGPVTVTPGTGAGVGVPGPYMVDIALATPFLYDPGAGDLVIDTDYVAGTFSGGSLVGLDVTSVNPLVSRVYSSTLYPNANGVDSLAPVIEIVYTPASGNVATNTVLGQGCLRQFASFYEMFATPAAFDLANTAISMFPAGGSYIVTPGGSFLPIGSVQASPTALPLGDDAAVQQAFTVATFAGPSGPWTGVNVISNGCIAEAAGNTTVAAPNPGTLLGAPQTGFYTQADFDPVGGTGAGTIWYEESAGVVSITWDNVASWNNPGSTNTFQFQLYPSGQVTIAWQGMAAVGSNGGVLVGYSPGGASADPGNTDLSALVGALVLGAPDVQPLTVTGLSRPITGTNWNLGVSNIPATGVIGVDIFGLADPGLNDLGFLGMPGCGLRATLDGIVAWPVTGATHAHNLPIPANPSLINVHVFTTSAVFSNPPVNAFGAITANGIDGRIGDV
jgi:hypothetical protein